MGGGCALHKRTSCMRVQFTCAYSSPERSNACDQRKVDVWAAGCILFELCTGTPFIQARTERERFVVMAQFYDAEWRPPRLPKPMSCWQPLLDAMMAKDPEQRLLPADLLRFDVFACAASQLRSDALTRTCQPVTQTSLKFCSRCHDQHAGVLTHSLTRSEFAEASGAAHGRAWRQRRAACA